MAGNCKRKSFALCFAATVILPFSGWLCFASGIAAAAGPVCSASRTPSIKSCKDISSVLGYRRVRRLRPRGAESGGRVGGKARKNNIVQQIKELLASDLGLQAMETMMDALQYNITFDKEVPFQVRGTVASLGGKYRNFRDLSRDSVQEVKETAAYFVKLLGRVEEEARSKRPGGLRRVELTLSKMTSRLESQQSKLDYCVTSYAEVQSDLKELTAQIKSLQQESDSKAGTIALATLFAGLLSPAALVLEEAALAVAAGSAGVLGSVLAADYRGLNDLYGEFLLRLQEVDRKVQQEQDKLKSVDTALREAAAEASYVGEDFTEEDFLYMAEAAEDAKAAFAKLEGRCEGYLVSSAFSDDAGLLLLSG